MPDSNSQTLMLQNQWPLIPIMNNLPPVATWANYENHSLAAYKGTATLYSHPLYASWSLIRLCIWTRTIDLESRGKIGCHSFQYWTNVTSCLLLMNNLLFLLVSKGNLFKLPINSLLGIYISQCHRCSEANAWPQYCIQMLDSTQITFPMWLTNGTSNSGKGSLQNHITRGDRSPTTLQGPGAHN